MSHLFGLQAGHVEEMEIVTGLGDVVHCSPDVNSDLFDMARGGLGQFGVVTSVTLPLMDAPEEIITLKMFYSQDVGQEHFIKDMERFAEMKIDMIHGFLKTSTTECISTIVGKDKYSEVAKVISGSHRKWGKGRRRCRRTACCVVAGRRRATASRC